MELKLHNTLSQKLEKFEPLNKKKVLIYSCGPTVYGLQHIGNLSMFVFTDLLCRAIRYAGFDTKQVINFTDFGHLSGDNEGDPDIGEDKMSKGLKREGLGFTMENMKILAKKYAEIFLLDLDKLNIEKKHTIFPYASDFIKEQIEIIETLLQKDMAYIKESGVYFDTQKFNNYGKLGNIDLFGIEEGIRVAKNEKKFKTDFILWKKDPKIGWQSPWGLGFPGWHIECSAMAINILGKQIDIHTGGIEHIPIHHNNEIAQSESYTGKEPFSKFWLHRAHLKIDDSKIAKSSGTAVYINDFKSHSIHPLSFRYWLLTSHYRTPANFTWDAVLGAQIAFEKLINNYIDLPKKDSSDKKIKEKFEEYIGNDLNTSLVLALLQEARSKSSIENIDGVLGLNIKKLAELIVSEIPEEILDLKKERDDARENRDWQKSDVLRDDIEKQGYVLEDKRDGTFIRKKLVSLI